MLIDAIARLYAFVEIARPAPPVFEGLVKHLRFSRLSVGTVAVPWLWFFSVLRDFRNL